MVMTPRTHPRGTRPDFTLPKPNPNPSRITDALWWLRCMRLALEPLSADGGILAIKPGYHSYGSRLPDFGPGDPRTDHSIRRTADRTGKWWKQYASAHDWTFNRAHGGNYAEIRLYTGRLVRSMQDPDDTRPDDVYAYTIGQIDGDRAVEGWNEYKDQPETGDSSHLWHRHDSFRRNIVGDYWAMWKALTIDMGWTFAEWRRSTEEDGMAGITQKDFDERFLGALKNKEIADRLKVIDGQGTHDQVIGRSGVTVGQSLESTLVLLRSLAARDFTDEPGIVAGVLAGLDPAAIAAAIPTDLAQRVADELATRLKV